MALPEPCDRRVIGHPVRRDDPERDVLDTRALDPARRALPTRVRVHQQRDHHRRIVRGATLPITAIHARERVEIHPSDDVEDEPDEVVGRQPLPQARRQQLLLTITPDEVLAHTPASS